MAERPRVTYDPAITEQPFVLMVEVPQLGARPMRAELFLSHSKARCLRLDIERAEQEDMERRTCENNRHHVEVVEVLPSGGVLWRCRHCPAEMVVERDGSVVPVGEGI